MTIAIENTNLMHDILLALKADGKGVSQVSAAGGCYVVKPKRDTIA